MPQIDKKSFCVQAWQSVSHLPLTANLLTPWFHHSSPCLTFSGNKKTNSHPSYIQPMTFLFSESQPDLLRALPAGEETVVANRRVQFTIWDTSGSRDISTYRTLAYREADVFFLCYKISYLSSLFSAINHWVHGGEAPALPELRQHAPATPLAWCSAAYHAWCSAWCRPAAYGAGYGAGLQGMVQGMVHRMVQRMVLILRMMQRMVQRMVQRMMQHMAQRMVLMHHMVQGMVQRMELIQRMVQSNLIRMGKSWIWPHQTVAISHHVDAFMFMEKSTLTLGHGVAQINASTDHFSVNFSLPAFLVNVLLERVNQRSPGQPQHRNILRTLYCFFPNVKPSCPFILLSHLSCGAMCTEPWSRTASVAYC